MNEETQYVTTISIDLSHMDFFRRIGVLPKILKLPFNDRYSLFKEYTEWKVLGLFPKKWNKLAYIVDHSIFWGFYCLWAVFKGKAKGFEWYLGHSGVHIYGLKREIHE